MRKTVASFLFVLLLASLSLAQKRAMTVDDMWAMKRIGDVALSPDGKLIAFSLTRYNMEENEGNSDIWLMSSESGQPRQLTTSDKYDGAPKWSPDGSAIAFLSSRDGSMQIYELSLAGGEAKKITDFPVDVQGFCWSPDGSHFAFSTNVFADTKTLHESAARDKQRKESKVQARIIDHLFFRAWNRWTDGKRSHVFVCDEKGGNVIDLTPGEYDTPPLDLGGAHDFVFSPDGKEMAFVSNHDAMPAASTNIDIFLVPVKGGDATCLTTANKAVDNQPVYSPDGKYMVFTSTRSGDLDLWRYEIATGKLLQLTHKLGYDGGAFFSHDSKQIVWRASRPKGKAAEIYKKLLSEGFVEPKALNIFVSDIDGKNVKQVTNLPGANWAPFFSPNDKKIIFSSNINSLKKGGRFFELFMINIDGTGLEQITHSKIFNSFPMFSHDGKKIVFASNRTVNKKGNRYTNIFVADWIENPQPVDFNFKTIH